MSYCFLGRASDKMNIVLHSRQSAQQNDTRDIRLRRYLVEFKDKGEGQKQGITSPQNPKSRRAFVNQNPIQGIVYNRQTYSDLNRRPKLKCTSYQLVPICVRGWQGALPLLTIAEKWLGLLAKDRIYMATTKVVDQDYRSTNTVSRHNMHTGNT